MGELTQKPRAVSRRRTEGLTLLEVTIAMVILGGGLLAMLAVQIQALQQGTHGRHTTEAAQVVRTQMEFLQRIPWTDARIQPIAGWSAVLPVSMTVQSPTGGQVQQVFNLQWRIVAGADPDIRTIDMRALWNEATQRAGAPQRRYAMSTVRFRDPKWAP